MSTLWLTFIVLFFSHFIIHPQSSITHANGSFLGNETRVGKEEKMVPLMEEKMMMMKMEMNDSRRKLRSFRICALCTCCGRGVCLPSPCCYAINCNIPNRPFGFCSFTPKTCNCFGCHL